MEKQTPLHQFKKTFTPLYRTLLILSTFAALASLADVARLQMLFSYLTSDPAYAASGLLMIFITLPLMIASIILLWHKHPTGIKLRLTGYAVALAAGILQLSTSEATRATITEEIRESAIQNNTGITPEMAASIAEASFTGAIYLAILSTILFAYLWWRAWKHQVRIDKKRSS